MPKENPGKFTLVATHEKLRRGKGFVQVEGELTEAQWNEIVDGLMKLIRGSMGITSGGLEEPARHT